MDIYKKADVLYNKLIETKIIYLLISFAILSSYYILYIFRDVDNSVLMGWSMVFYYRPIHIYKLLLILSIVILISFIISRINLFNKYNEEKYHILLLFFSGLIIGSLFWNIPEISPDAARYFTEAKYLELNGIKSYFNDWGHELFAYVDFPSIPFFYGLIFRYLGEYRIYIQIFNTILLSITSILTYKISKRLWNEEIGFYSGLLLMSFPFLLSQIPQMMIDIPFMFLVILSVFLIFKIFDNKYYSILASLVVFFAVYAKSSSLLFIIPPAISILIINYKSVFENKNRWIFMTIFSMVIILLFFFLKMDVFIGDMHIIRAGLKENTYFESDLNYLFQIGTIIIFLAFFSIIVAYKKKDKNYFVLIPWFVIPFLIFHNGRIRYMISVFPVIAMMASFSLFSISHKHVKKFLILSLILTSIAFVVYAYIPYEENYTDKNLKDAAEFTNTLNFSEIEVYLVFHEKYPNNPEPFVPFFDLYSNQKIVYSDNNKFYPGKDYSNSWTAFYKIPNSYYHYLRSDSSNNDRIIVVISEKEQSNSLPARYLEDHILIKKFESKTFSVLNPSSVKVYLPIDNYGQ